MKKHHTLHHAGLILALVGLISAATLIPYPGNVACAQASGPSWTYTGNLNTGRVFHTATLLPNGKVLVTGGQSGADSAELYDPATGTWSFTGTLNTPRSFDHTTTLLPNGKVLVAGGYSGAEINSAELYDPSTGTWTSTGNLNEARHSHTATLLPDGKVLVAGGGDTDAGTTDSAELYDPATGTWSITGSLHTARGRHTATLLSDGRVLVAGGTDGFFPSLHSSELYDPNTGTWSVTGSLNTDRVLFTATKLPNGSVLVAGGESHQCSVSGCGFSTVTNSAELYNPAAGTWSYTGNLSYRAYHTATLLPNGQVLVAGGGGFAAINSAEIYDPATGNWSSTASLNTPRSFHTATLLSNGKVLVVGGRNSSILASAELYDSGSIAAPNPIDDAPFFVRQHYLDFLNREPEPDGLAAWLGVLNRCPDLHNDPDCDRITVSADFFGSPEFQLKGFYVFRFYRAAFNRLPQYDEIAPDMQSVTGRTPEEVYANKAAFANSLVLRQEFINSFGALSNADFVAALLNRYQLDSITAPDPANPDGAVKVTLSNGDLTAILDAGTLTRAQVLRAIADSDEVNTQEYNRAFVAMQYYGYLRRTPEEGGYNAWLNYLNTHPTDFREMVRGFVDSIEYRKRFGQP